MADDEDLKLLKSGEIDLSRCDFREANLDGMDLRGRNFTHSMFENAKCEGTRFDESNFRGAHIGFMKAAGASFDSCDVSGLLFSFVDFSRASLRDAVAKGATLHNAKLTGADISGADFSNGKIDVDTDLQGVVADKNTEFEGLRVLRPTSRHPLFSGYAFKEGRLSKQQISDETLYKEARESAISPEMAPRGQSANILTADLKIRHLMQNTAISRYTAQQFALQIESILKDVLPANGNELPEPLQTALEGLSLSFR